MPYYLQTNTYKQFIFNKPSSKYLQYFIFYGPIALQEKPNKNDRFYGPKQISRIISFPLDPQITTY